MSFNQAKLIGSNFAPISQISPIKIRIFVSLIHSDHLIFTCTGGRQLDHTELRCGGGVPISRYQGCMTYNLIYLVSKFSFYIANIFSDLSVKVPYKHLWIITA